MDEIVDYLLALMIIGAGIFIGGARVFGAIHEMFTGLLKMLGLMK